ncbi:MAG: nitrilase-related carbon-nitrogen hydrolase, partial [Planctomycetota bacterium]
GSPQLTRDISRFTAREGRMYVCASSGVMKVDDLPADLPLREQLAATAEDGLLHTGGSRIVAPTGEELASLDEPKGGIVTADLDRATLYAERHNFDPAGHYSRPEILELTVERRRMME